MSDVKLGIIENDADAAGGGEFEKDTNHVGLVQIVREDVESEAGIGNHRVED